MDKTKEIKHDNEMVTAYFRMKAFDDKARGFLESLIRKAPNKNIYRFSAIDGQKIKVPRYVISHLSSLFVTSPANEADDGERKKVYRFELDVV